MEKAFNIRNYLLKIIGPLITVALVALTFLITSYSIDDITHSVKKSVTDIGFWFLVITTSTISLLSVSVNYKSSVQTTKEKPELMAVRMQYKEVKDDIKPGLDKLQDFCSLKTSMLRLSIIKEIIETAGLKYSSVAEFDSPLDYIKANQEVLQPWQIDLIKSTLDVEVEPLMAGDLLRDGKPNKFNALLGASEERLAREYLTTKAYKKVGFNLITVLGVGTQGAFENIYLGISAALGVLLNAGFGTLDGIVMAKGAIRDLYLDKINLLNEFKIHVLKEVKETPKEVKETSKEVKETLTEVKETPEEEVKETPIENKKDLQVL